MWYRELKDLISIEFCGFLYFLIYRQKQKEKEKSMLVLERIYSGMDLQCYNIPFI